MIILAAVLIFAIVLWTVSANTGHETEARKVAIRVKDDVRKRRNSRVIDD